MTPQPVIEFMALRMGAAQKRQASKENGMRIRKVLTTPKTLNSDLKAAVAAKPRKPSTKRVLKHVRAPASPKVLTVATLN